MKRLKVQIVFHTAAYKHVSLMEANPVAAIQNNFFGTLNLINASVASEVDRFVMISTDKAVEPICVYGISKSLAEELVLRERRKNRNYFVVRFGNVLGSRGSILPLLKKQILLGGPVTITHPDVNRFFMTIPEATSLVLKAGGIILQGDLFILDMGEPLYIKDLAAQLISFYGFEPEKDIKIEYTQLNPGEKISENIWSKEESPVSTEHPKILSIKKETSLLPQLDNIIHDLNHICIYNESNADKYRNRKELKKILKKLYPGMVNYNDEPEF